MRWLRRTFTRDPGQLGLFDTASADAPSVAPAPAPAPRKQFPPHLRLLPDSQSVIVTPPVEPVDIETRDGAIADSLTACIAEPAPAAVVSPRTASPDPEAMLYALRMLGLRGVEKLVFTRNRHTMVSLASGVLRLHEGFAAAPPDVHEAIATFATSRNRAKRSAAKSVIVSYPVPVLRPRRRPAAQHPDDLPMATRLTALHAELNLVHFDGALATLDVQVSRRLARRLGHYTLKSDTGGVGEIVISRRHVRRDGWGEATHTLLHEMVHQWQDETGRPVDHGVGFRAKCREVGIQPAATRMITR